MKESIGGAWLLGIVMTFMVILITFVTLSLNYSTVFRLKSDMISAIEEAQGFNSYSAQKINGLIQDYGYQQKKTCQFKNRTSGVIGIDRDDPKFYVNNFNKAFSYCVMREENDRKKNREYDSQVVSKHDDKEAYYTLQLSFGFNLPVLGDILTFRVNGETRGIIYPNEEPYEEAFSKIV